MALSTMCESIVKMLVSAMNIVSLISFWQYIAIVVGNFLNFSAICSPNESYSSFARGGGFGSSIFLAIFARMFSAWALDFLD